MLASVDAFSVLHLVIGIAVILLNTVGLWKLHRNSKEEGQFYLVLKLMGWLGMISLTLKIVSTIFSAVVQGQSMFRLWNEQLFPLILPWTIPIWTFTETMYYFMAAILCYERKRACMGLTGYPIKWRLVLIPMIVLGLVHAVPSFFYYQTFLSEESTVDRTVYKVKYTNFAIDWTNQLINIFVLRPIVFLVPLFITIWQVHGLGKTNFSAITEEVEATSLPMQAANTNSEEGEDGQGLSYSSNTGAQKNPKTFGIRTAILFITGIAIQFISNMLSMIGMYYYSSLIWPFQNFCGVINTIHLGTSLIFYVFME